MDLYEQYCMENLYYSLLLFTETAQQQTMASGFHENAYLNHEY